MINCYTYMEKDFDTIRFNKWAWYLKCKKNSKALKDYLKKAEAFTLFDGDKPIAILGFHEYDINKFDGCIVADECFGDNPKYAIKMKQLINICRDKYKMKRVQTTSEDAEALNKWHEFLGFKVEKENVMSYRGHSFKLWSM